MSRATRQVLVAIVIAFVAAFLSGSSVKFIAPLANLETKLADIRVAAMQPAMPPSSDVVVIAIDEATLAAFSYRSPVDRGLVADLIEQLEDKGAAAIGVDIIVDQPTQRMNDFARSSAPQARRWYSASVRPLMSSTLISLPIWRRLFRKISVPRQTC